MVSIYSPDNGDHRTAPNYRGTRTTAPAKEEVSVEQVFALLDEAAETLDTNETVALAVNKYLLTYIEHIFPEGIDGLSIEGDLITIQNTEDIPLSEQLRYLIFLSYLTE